MGAFIDEDAAHGIRYGVLRELVAHFLKNAYIDPRFIFVVLRDKIGIELDPQDHLFGIGAKDMICFEEYLSINRGRLGDQDRRNSPTRGSDAESEESGGI